MLWPTLRGIRQGTAIKAPGGTRQIPWRSRRDLIGYNRAVVVLWTTFALFCSAQAFCPTESVCATEKCVYLNDKQMCAMICGIQVYSDSSQPDHEKF